MKSLKDMLNGMDDDRLRKVRRFYRTPPTCGIVVSGRCVVGLATCATNCLSITPTLANPSAAQTTTTSIQSGEKLRKLGNLTPSPRNVRHLQTDLPMLTPTQRQSLVAPSIARSYASSPDGWLLLEGTYGCGKPISRQR
jgi:hypothetical protein